MDRKTRCSAEVEMGLAGPLSLRELDNVPDYFSDAFPKGQDFYRPYGKRLIDIVGAVLLLIAFLPLMVVFACWVAIGGGSPFFSHTRIGQNNRKFGCLKIRSMYPDAEQRLEEILRTDKAAAMEWERDFKLDNDPRVTPIGNFMRKTSLDELPQIWNVLKGDMSLVGPRPVTAVELERYGAGAADYCSVRPGLTGPWQVQGRNDISYQERVAIDVEYVENMTFLGDVQVLLATTLVVLRATGK